MKVVVNELEGCKRGLEVEIPGEQVAEEFERSFKEYSRHAKIPGFRPGKIPIDIVRRRFGKEVRDEVNTWLKEEARRRNVSVSALKERLAQNERLTGLRAQIVREKSLDFAFNGANITHEGK